MKKAHFLLTGAAVAMALASGATSASAETVKIAFIDPLSGMMGSLGTNELRSWQYAADIANQQNWSGGPKLEVVGFDNELSTQQSLTML